MGMTFSHLLHGFAGFTATVVMLWRSADPGVIRIATMLVLGFILLVVAIVVFLRSIKEKEKQASKQGDATESQLLQTLEQAIEEGRASLDLEVAAPPITHAEIPAPPTEPAPQFDQILPQPDIEPKPQPSIETKTEHVQTAQSALNGTNGTNFNGIAHPPANPARPETTVVDTARVSLPRLSELRGMRFSQALRELDKAKRSAPANAGPYSLNASLNDAVAHTHNDTPAGTHNGALNDPINDPISETLLSAIAPFETMFAPTASAPAAQNGAIAMHEIGAAATKDNGAQGPSQQAFFPAKPAQPDRRRSRRDEKDRRSSPREPKAPGQETGGFLDQLQILPSRRGQYKKKA
jgi:hypothetical protein